MTFSSFKEGKNNYMLNLLVLL